MPKDLKSPTLVARFATIRLLYVIAVFGLEIRIADITTAFLNAILKEVIYMAAPQGYEKYRNGVKLVKRLNKAIYVLKQAGRNWNELMDEELAKIGLKVSKIDPCLYVLEFMQWTVPWKLSAKK